MQNVQETDGNSLGYIPLAQMPQAKGVLRPEDDWTGVSDQLSRRKKQNRINRRAYRQRKRKDTSNTSESLQGKTIDGDLGGRTAEERLRECDAWGPRQVQICTATLKQALNVVVSICQQPNKRLPHREALGIHSHIDAMANSRLFLQLTDIPDPSSKVLFPLSVDHLLTLVQYNVFRAMLANALCLGIDATTICLSTASSPFVRTDMAEPNLIPPVPPTLQPTELQKSIPHHPIVDLFPIPQIRDNILRATDTYDSGALVADIFDTGKQVKSLERNGLIIWAEPWQQDGWEVSEGFAKKWAWVLEGCEEILRSTDYWRDKRGEPPLMEIF